MKDFYEFASNSLFLTFFLVVIVGSTITGVVKALRGVKWK